MAVTDTVDVAIVGGGPAGSATATRLARLGHSVTVFERQQMPRWRACGVFASPLTRRRLVALGLSPAEVDELCRPIAAMELESTRGAACRLEYAHGYACGFDRVRLDARLLELAVAAGAVVRRATVVRDIGWPVGAAGAPFVVSSPVSGDDQQARATTSARVVVGADGGGSRVARAAGVANERNWLGRSAVTFHQRDAAAAPAGDAMSGRFVLGGGWYVGVAPVPDGRVNVGIVVPTSELRDGVEPVVQRVLGSLATAATATAFVEGVRTDEAQVAGRLEHHVTRAAGDGWLLVGDAAGFTDPLTGEGLHRSLLTAEFAADAIHSWLRGDREALAVYDRRIRSRFRSKNVFSLVLQAFISNPRVLDYALDRLNRRASLREQLTAVLTDELPASRALDPRFMGRLLAP